MDHAHYKAIIAGVFFWLLYQGNPVAASIHGRSVEELKQCLENLENLRAQEDGFSATSMFPDPRSPGSSSLIQTGNPINAETLIDAYMHGIFPWSAQGEDRRIHWHSLPFHGIIDFSNYRVPTNVRKLVRKNLYRVTFNKAFKRVMHECAAQPRYKEDGTLQNTWIGPEWIRGYTELHERGLAHSVEVWEGDELVGGLYGVFIGNVFTGESMFHKRDKTSQIALHYLIEHLRSIGLNWIDTQHVTGATRPFGAVLVERDRYLSMLKQAHAMPDMDFYGRPETD